MEVEYLRFRIAPSHIPGFFILSLTHLQMELPFILSLILWRHLGPTTFTCNTSSNVFCNMISSVVVDKWTDCKTMCKWQKGHLGKLLWETGFVNEITIFFNKNIEPLNFTSEVKRGRDGMIISKGFGSSDFASNRFLKSSRFLKPEAVLTCG